MSNRIFLSPPHMSGEELRFIHEAFDSNYIAPVGPMVDAFEAEFAEKVGIPHVCALSCGTAAIHLALRILGVGPGDEVAASTLTFIGSVSPITFVGATPVFIDSDWKTWNMDPDLLAEELYRCNRNGRLPKAIIPTDLYGQCADYDRIRGICDPYGIPVVADAAEALGALYYGNGQSSTSIGTARCAGAGVKAAAFSFNGNKIITTSGGGMLASDDRDLIEQARFLSQQARDPAPHYEHSQIGYNYRMSNILAAIGRGQLGALEDRVMRKRKIFDNYRKNLEHIPGIDFMPEAPYGRSNRWLTVILIDPAEFGADREAVRLALEAENIEARPVWKPMHRQPVFRAAGRKAHGVRRTELNGEKDEERSQDSSKLYALCSTLPAPCPTPHALCSTPHASSALSSTPPAAYPCRVVGGAVSEALFDKGLCLPSGTAMTEEDQQRVIAVVRKCHGMRGKRT